VPCKIGDTGPGGGIVFYAAGTRQAWGQYLEAAKVDLNKQWCKPSQGGYWRMLQTRMVIGAGRSNTEIIIQSCGPDSAAGVAAAYRGGGKDDWFLPSRDELDALYQQRGVVGVAGTRQASGKYLEAVTGDYYWSSSQFGGWANRPNPSFAWVQNFGHGVPYEGYKGVRHRVRPVRAF
jgi:hypothetical protein